MIHMVINLLALALFLVFLPITTLAAPGDAVLLPYEGETETYIEQSVAVVGDTLYIFRPGEGLYSYHVGDEAPVMLMDLKRYDTAGTEKTMEDDLRLKLKYYQQMSASSEASANDDKLTREFAAQLRYIVDGGDKLYALDRSCERLWAFNEGKSVFEPALDLDTSIIKSGSEDQQWINAYNPRIIDGFLYILVRDYDPNKPGLKKFDLSTGAAIAINIDNVYTPYIIDDYAPYKDGKLLVCLSWNTKEIGVFDLETGKYEKKMDKEISEYYGLLYNSEIDAHYMWRTGEIIRSIAFGAWETVAYVSATNYGDFSCAWLPGGYLAVGMLDCVQVLNTDPQFLSERPLRLNGITWENMTSMFIKANPDVPIAYSSEFFINIEDMVAHMTGPNKADIYPVYSGNIDLGDLYKKGHLADLSANRTIAEVVDRMYPNIREALTFDGKIVAIPYEMHAETFGVNLETLERIGLTKDEVPKSYYALLEFIERWISEYSVDYPGIKLFAHSGCLYNEDLDKQQLINAILCAQIAFCSAQGEPLTFDTSVMRKLLAKLESIDFTLLSENVNFGEVNETRIGAGIGSGSISGSSVICISVNSAPLFSFYNIITCNPYKNFMDWEFEPMPLALDEGMPAILDTFVGWLVLNQKSADYEEAMRFMQYSAENMYPLTRVNTMPDENEPIEDQYYTQNIKNYQEQLDILDTLLEMADEDTKQLIEADIQSYKRSMEIDEKQRWAATPEFIARYRSIYDHIMIEKVDAKAIFFYNSYDETSSLISKYVEKQINGDQFIMELNQMLPMAQMDEVTATEIPGYQESKGIMNGMRTILAAFSGLSEGLQVAIITGTLAMITGIVVAIINKERKKKAKEQPPSSSITVTQHGSIYNGKGAGAVAGGNQDFSDHKNEKG